jgi:ATPase subunit of ABC transporter with duplicated ATPase domains
MPFTPSPCCACAANRRNGTGKSTLLHVLGTRTLVGFPAWLSCMHVEQEASASDTTTAVACVLQADAAAVQLQR